MKIPPGISQTPQIPLELDLTGVGYDAVKRALGKSLEIDAVAKVDVKVGRYTDVVNYFGKGISANVRV